MKRLILTLLMLPQLLLSADWNDQAAEGFFASVSYPHEVTIPENAIIELVLIHPKTYHTSIDKLKQSLLDTPPLQVAPFLLLSAGALQENLSDQLVREKMLFVVQPQLPGSFNFSFKKIDFIPNEDGQSTPVHVFSDLFKMQFSFPKNADIIPEPLPLVRLSSDIPIEMTLQNRTKLINNEALKIVEAERNKEIFFQKAFPWLEIILTTLVIIFLLASQYAPKAKIPELTPEARERKLREESLKRLQNIESEPSPEKFYVALTDTVRHYLEQHYQIHASTQTTNEFLVEAAQNPELSEDTREVLSHFLLHADQVKFALHTPSAAEQDEAMIIAKRIVQTTR